jgi:single-strand DNA-binding protein
LQVRSYDAQDGQRRYVTEVVADEITFLSSKKDGGNNTNTQQSSDNTNMSAIGLDEDFHLMADDDDIPF